MGNKYTIRNSAERILKHLNDPDEFKPGASLYTERRKDLEEICDILSRCVDQIHTILGEKTTRGKSASKSGADYISRDEFEATIAKLKESQFRPDTQSVESECPAPASNHTISKADPNVTSSAKMTAAQKRLVKCLFTEALDSGANAQFNNSYALNVSRALHEFFHFRFIEYGNAGQVAYPMEKLGLYVQKYIVAFIYHAVKGSHQTFYDRERDFRSLVTSGKNTFPLAAGVEKFDFNMIDTDMMSEISAVWDELMSCPAYFGICKVNINDPEIRRAFLDADIISFVNDNKSADDGEEGVAAV
jgi:hypothetical protein